MTGARAETGAGVRTGAGVGTGAGVRIQEKVYEVRAEITLLLVGTSEGPSTSSLSTKLVNRGFWHRLHLKQELRVIVTAKLALET